MSDTLNAYVRAGSIPASGAMPILADYQTNIYMNQLKWGEIPIGSVVYNRKHRPQIVFKKTDKSVCVLDMYHNKVMRHGANKIVNVLFKISRP